MIPDRFQVHVSQEDIDEGDIGSSARCPLALALRECDIDAYVDSQFAHLDMEKYEHDAYWFVAAFDHGKPVYPRIVSFWKFR